MSALTFSQKNVADFSSYYCSLFVSNKAELSIREHSYLQAGCGQLQFIDTWQTAGRGWEHAGLWRPLQHSQTQVCYTTTPIGHHQDVSRLDVTVSNRWLALAYPTRTTVKYLHAPQGGAGKVENIQFTQISAIVTVSLVYMREKVFYKEI